MQDTVPDECPEQVNQAILDWVDKYLTDTNSSVFPTHSLPLLMLVCRKNSLLASSRVGNIYLEKEF